jgi:hypothetical protein
LGNHDTDRPFAEFITKISAQELIVSRPPEAAEIEMLREDRDVHCRFGIQGRSKG